MDLRSHMEWIGSNSLCLYRCPNPQAKRSSYGTGEECSMVTDYCIEQISWNVCTRRLVNQSYGYFMQLQKLVAKEEKESGQLVSAEVLVSSSRLYLASIHECVLGLRKMAEEEEGVRMDDEDDMDEEEESELNKQVSLYAMLELAWHLCQVIFLEALPAGCLIQQLQEWVTWNCMSGKDKMEEVLTSPCPDELDSYWPVIYRLVLQGKLNQASELLQKNSKFHQQSNAFTSMQRLLERAPMLQPTTGLSRAELRRRWSDWRREAGRRKQAGEFTLVPPLTRLAKILSGDEDVYLENTILESCEEWYELMVGKLLYTCPLVMSTDYELCYTAEWSRRELARFRGEIGMETEEVTSFAMDELLLAALRNDFMGVVQVCSSKTPNWWFSAHLANLLRHKGLLVEQRLKSAPKLCEFLLVEYSCILMGHESLWQLALGYLAHCPEQGQHYMQLLIRRIPMDTERKANKVLQLCRQYQLKESIVADLCKVMAMRCYKNGRIGAALSWCIRGKNSVFAAFLAEKYMESFDSLGEFADLDLLDHLDGVMLMNKKLMFLAKYRNYHKHCENEDFQEAGQLLSTLLMSETVPERFLPTLLGDVHNLLTKEDLVFDVEQTYALSHFVVQLTLTTPPSASTQEFQSKKSMDSLMPELQLALVNNLSRAIMMQSSSN